MARGRMIDKVIVLSRKINSVSEGAENLYYRVNTHADDFGRYYADPTILKGQIYPLRKISVKEIANRIDQLWKIKLIKLYKANGESYLEIVAFEEHQTFKSDRPKKAEFPIPKGFLEPTGIQLEPNGSLSKDKLSKDKLREVPSSEEKTFGPLFEELWKQWPPEGRFKKKYCRTKFLALCKQGKLEDFKKTARGYSDYLRHKKENENFAQQPMYLSTFLNNWEEEKERYVNFKYQARL